MTFTVVTRKMKEVSIFSGTISHSNTKVAQDDYNDDAILDEELAIAPNSSQASCDSTTTMGAFQTGPATDFEQDDQHEEEISEEEEEEPKHSFHSTRGRRS
jgi:hypothetical protein